MKLFSLVLILFSSPVFAEPFETNCYKYWDEEETNPEIVVQYRIIQDEWGYAEAYDCRKNSEKCKSIGEIKDDPRNTDFSMCKIHKRGKKFFSICHGDFIPTRETSVGTLITLQFYHKGKNPVSYLCDEIYFGGETKL